MTAPGRAALVNAGLLLIAVGGIAVEAINRIQEPAAVSGWTVVLVATLGIVVNGGTALLFMRGRHGDLNIRGAYLHILGDLLAEPGGTTHADSLFGDACVDDQVAAYLGNGTLPPRKHGSGPDTTCAPLPVPVPPLPLPTLS